MSTNKNWTADEWRAWFLRCHAKIGEFDERVGGWETDHKRRKELQGSLRARFPQAFRVKVADVEQAAYRRLFNAFDRVNKAQTPCWRCSEHGLGVGGGTFEGGHAGTIARTFHEDDDPDGPCKNCGHVNSDAEKATLEDRRRKNSDWTRQQMIDATTWASEQKERLERDELKRLQAKYGAQLAADPTEDRP